MLANIRCECTVNIEIRIPFECSSCQGVTFSNIYPFPFKSLASSRHINAYRDFLKC